MIRAGFGQSVEPGSAAFSEAVSQALITLDGQELEIVFLFASGDRCKQAGDGLAAAIGVANTDRVVGCSGLGILSTTSELETKSGVVALAVGGDAIDAVPFIVPAEEAAMHLQAELAPHASESGLLCLFSAISSGHPGDLIAQLSSDFEFPIVGGAASGSRLDPVTYQWLGMDIRTDGVAGVLLKGEFEILTGVAQGCQPFGQAYTITKAEKNVIYELAFSPAVDALKEALDHLTPAQKENVGPSIFAGIAIDEYDSERNRGDFLIRNLMGMNPDDGSIAIVEGVEVGQTLQFNRRTADAAHMDLEQTTQAILNNLAGRKVQFGLYFNCLGRGFGLYGRPDHDVEVIRRDLGPFPLAGFFGNAEFAPVGGMNFVHSYTGGLVIFTELSGEVSSGSKT